MLALIRSFIFTLIGTVLTVVYGTISLLLGGLPQVTRHRIIISWCNLIIGLARWVCGVKYEVVGREHLKNLDSPVVVMSKHQSTWETLYLQILFFPASTILKKSLLDIPFFGWGLRGLRPIGIDRDNPRDALRQVKSGGVQGIYDGLNVIIFPEGTRMKQGERGKYARSGAEIAVTSGAKVIPIAMNAGVYWPNKEFTKYPGTIHLVIGEPIITTDKTSREVTIEVEQWIEHQMASMPTQR
ncbi:lysophospholipid acyltransferase family protein [Marinagarivorans algicola]|uniref:lysophospholipid acyltransferase family protein n=1 Tax=Marinagarivorans algicola TaxID=1513270 RepID=UPI0006B9F8AF|nr:lysophospholipid acyltransferase family protein [Marinagarivorans algicola]